MAYQKHEWIDRVSEHPSRRLLTAVEGESNVFDITRAEGNVTAPGDAFNADTMNDLEDRIDGGFNDVLNNALNGRTLFVYENHQAFEDSKPHPNTQISFELE